MTGEVEKVENKITSDCYVTYLSLLTMFSHDLYGIIHLENTGKQTNKRESQRIETISGRGHGRNKRLLSSQV